MEWLAAQGLLLAVELGIGLICSVIGLFFGHIILFDSIALGILAGAGCGQIFSLHPAFCLAIGVGVFLLLLLLQNTRVGFWIIGGLLTLAYALFFSALAYSFSHQDPIWGWVVFGLSLLLIGGLHLHARNKA